MWNLTLRKKQGSLLHRDSPSEIDRIQRKTERVALIRQRNSKSSKIPTDTYGRRRKNEREEKKSC